MRTTKFWTVLTETLITEQGGNVTTVSSKDGTASPEQQVQRWLPDCASPGRCNSQISAWLNSEDPSVADGVVISSSANTLFIDSYAFLFYSEFTKNRCFCGIINLQKKMSQEGQRLQREQLDETVPYVTNNE